MVYVSSNTIITYALFFRDVALTVLSVVSLFLSVLWVSVFLYGSFYFLYMPSQTYEIGLNFKFEPCTGEEQIGVKCSFLDANVSFLSPENPWPDFSLLPGQSYMVSLELVLPPTENNLHMGMFMTCMTLKDAKGGDIQTKCLSAIMEQRSVLAQTMRTVMTYPVKMFFGGREKFLVNIDFFNNFQDNVHRPTRGASFVIQSRFIDVYESKLKIHAHFSGLRYLMYYYPVLSSCLGASLIGIVLSSVLAVTWKRFFDPAVVVKVDSFTEKQERAKAALGKSSSQMKIVQKIRSMKEINEDNDILHNCSNDFIQLERFVDDIHGGIEMTSKKCRQIDDSEDFEIRRRSSEQTNCQN